MSSKRKPRSISKSRKQRNAQNLRKLDFLTKHLQNYEISENKLPESAPPGQRSRQTAREWFNKTQKIVQDDIANEISNKLSRDHLNEIIKQRGTPFGQRNHTNRQLSIFNPERVAKASDNTISGMGAKKKRKSKKRRNTRRKRKTRKSKTRKR